MYKRWVPLIVLIVLCSATFPAGAQTSAQVELHDLQTATFPLMKLSVGLYDEQGQFVSGSLAGNFTVLEDGNLLPATTLVEQQVGVQLVVAINAGPAFATRDQLAISRYDKLSRFLQEWGSSLPNDTEDDLSLVVNGGIGKVHVQTPAQWLAALAAYEPDARNMMPSLQILSTALDIAAEPTPLPGMKRAVLLITPMPTEEDISVLQNLAARARELKIHVYTWVVASANEFVSAPSTVVKDLALQTGGQYFIYSGSETLPSPDEYLISLRRIYQLEYASIIDTAGSHTLSIQWTGDGVSLISQPVTFELDVQPPNPILVIPPEQIIRQMPGEGRFDALGLVPTAQDLEIIIEFPDGHPRPLRRTALYVDGQLAAENLAEPFDRFSWNLGGYVEDGQHLLQVEVTDSLGLSKTTPGYPIAISVLKSPGGLLPFLQRNTLWLTLGAVGVAGVALVTILLVSGKRRLSIRERRRLRRAYRDPVTQPVEAARRNPARQLPWQRALKPAPAHLARLRQDGKPSTVPLLPLVDPDATFGNDPVQAVYVFDDASVSPLHARIRRTADGGYLILDQKSVAGTWVNQEPVPPEGRRLQHGDVIHIGRITFRFLLHKPVDARPPRVTPAQAGGRDGAKKNHH